MRLCEWLDASVVLPLVEAHGSLLLVRRLVVIATGHETCP